MAGRTKKKLKTDGPIPDVHIENGIEFREKDWKVTVVTESALENALVAMVVYGDKGNTGKVILSSSAGHKARKIFQSGHIDEFKITLSGIGKMIKLRMELIPNYPKILPEWKIKEVKFKNMITKELLKFKYNSWLSRTKEDKEIMRELPAIRPGQTLLPVLKYNVETYTSNEPGADTEANVYINLFGGLGDTGKRLLHVSDKSEPFQEGQKDVFILEAVSIGSLKRVIISCDGNGPGEGWKCDKIIVREDVKAKREFYFPCRRWLDTSVGDGRLERYLRIKRAKFKEDQDGRDNFFHRLTGNKPGGLRMVVSDDGDSDPGFYQRFTTNELKLQHAMYLPDNSINDVVLSKEGQLPRIASPVSIQSSRKIEMPAKKRPIKLPEIHNHPGDTSRRDNIEINNNPTKKKYRHKRKKLKILDNEMSSSDDDELGHYPWKSEKNRKHIEEALATNTAKALEKNPDINVSKMIDRIENRNSGRDLDMDTPSGYDSTDGENARSIYSTQSGDKFLRKHKNTSKEVKLTGNTVPPVIYIGSKKHRAKHKSEKEDVSMQKENETGINVNDSVPETPKVIKKNETGSNVNDSVPETPKVIKKNETGSNVNDSVSETPNVIKKKIDKPKTNYNKYYPKTKKQGFPWDNSKSKSPVVMEPVKETSEQHTSSTNRTALVKPTQREDLNKSARERAMQREKGNKKTIFRNRSKTFTKEKNQVTIDSHFPSRVELRILARRARLQKQAQNSEGTTLPQIKKNTSKFYQGNGNIEARLRARQERMKEKEVDKLGVITRRPDNYGIGKSKGQINGPSHSDQRMKVKLEREKRKLEETEKLKAKLERETKTKKVVYMPPIEKVKPASYGDQFHAKQENQNKPRHEANSKLSQSTSRNSHSKQDSKLSKKQSSSRLSQNTANDAGVNKTPVFVDKEDSDIWNYFASVVNNLNTLEAKEVY